MGNDVVATKPIQKQDHLTGLRDLLNLPFNTLNDGALVFVLAGQYQVIARCVENRHISLICEIAKADALSIKDWDALIGRISSAYDYDWPVSLIAVSGQLALVWRAPIDVGIEEWLERAEDSLIWAMDLQSRVRSKTL